MNQYFTEYNIYIYNKCIYLYVYLPFLMHVFKDKDHLSVVYLFILLGSQGQGFGKGKGCYIPSVNMYNI